MKPKVDYEKSEVDFGSGPVFYWWDDMRPEEVLGLLAIIDDQARRESQEERDQLRETVEALETRIRMSAERDRRNTDILQNNLRLAVRVGELEAERDIARARETAERDAHVEACERIAELEAENMSLSGEIEEWVCASGIMRGDDPSGITPKDAAKYWEGVEAERDQLRARVVELDAEVKINHSSELYKEGYNNGYNDGYDAGLEDSR